MNRTFGVLFVGSLVSLTVISDVKEKVKTSVVGKFVSQMAPNFLNLTRINVRLYQDEEGTGCSLSFLCTVIGGVLRSLLVDTYRPALFWTGIIENAVVQR